ncbi:MAG: peptidase M28, partial [Chloroflexi bacterium]|nr:peptidase M28 [Chloroflexota bacterium]
PPAGADATSGPPYEALADMNDALESLYAEAAGLADAAVDDPRVRATNDALLGMARELVLINYTRKGRFRNEPPVRVPQLPDLAPALDLAEADHHMRRVTRTHLLRGVNRVAWAFETSANIARAALEKIGN